MKQVYNNSSEDELMHYGVIGMKWGVKRGKASDAYSKGIKKLKKLEDKEDKFRKKSEKYALRGTGITEISRANRQKSAELDAKARGFESKGKKFYKKMEKVFKDVPTSQLNSADLDYAKRYAERVLK